MRKIPVLLGASILVAAPFACDKKSENSVASMLQAVEQASPMPFPFISQQVTPNCANDCGPASVAMIVRGYGGIDDEDDTCIAKCRPIPPSYRGPCTDACSKQLIERVRARSLGGDCNALKSVGHLGEAVYSYYRELTNAKENRDCTHTVERGFRELVWTEGEDRIAAIRQAIKDRKPVIVFVNGVALGRPGGADYKHFILVTGLSGEKVYVNDPDSRSLEGDNWVAGGANVDWPVTLLESSIIPTKYCYCPGQSCYGLVVTLPKGDAYSNLQADVPERGQAQFQFGYRGGSASKAGGFRVSAAATPDALISNPMDLGTYPTSPIRLNNPASTVLGDNACGRGISWRVETLDGVASPITRSTVTCSAGKFFCGTDCTRAILASRADILETFKNSGWDTACSNHETIVNHWCSGNMSPGAAVDCAQEQVKHPECSIAPTTSIEGDTGGACGSTCTIAILLARPDIFQTFLASGWDLACENHETIVNHWCSGDMSPEAAVDCAQEKAKHSECSAAPVTNVPVDAGVDAWVDAGVDTGKDSGVVCGNACTEAILAVRPDIYNEFNNGGWDTSCVNHDAIIAHWCNGGVSTEAITHCIDEKAKHPECSQ